MLRINTIYKAFMGEVNMFGIGAPCTFVRLAGCNLRCYYRTKGLLCDTPEALGVSGEEMTEEEILAMCSTKLICLTGGEPLMQDVGAFLALADKMGYRVVVETNGTYSIEKYRQTPGVSFVVDRKSASSGESLRMTPDNYPLLNQNDFVKFVIDDEQDYAEALAFYNKWKWAKFNIAVGLFWGAKVSYDWLINRMRQDDFVAFLNMQTHKMACLYDYARKSDTIKEIFIPKNL